jgi:putative aldouronate transport system permease protein
MKNSNRIKQSRSDILVNIIVYTMGTIALIITLYPLYFVLIASISDASLIRSGQVYLYPKGLTLSGYQKVLEDTRIWIGYRNTIFYVVTGTFISLFFTLGVSYSLSRKDFKLRNPIMILFIFTMFFNGGLIPTYLWINKLGLYDTVWVMLIPFSINVFNVVVARTFFTNTIPDELLEASKIDGANDFYFFFRIVLPLSKPIIAVITLYYAVAMWNGYFNALIYLRSENLYTLQLILRSILILNQVAVDSQSIEMLNTIDLIKYAVIVVSTVPIICVYPFLQKYFAQGVMIGAVKG